MAAQDRRRIALVTGASGGIGRAEAVGLARSGADVAVLVRADGAGAEQTAQVCREFGVHAMVVRADVRRSDEVSQAISAVVETLGGLDILVNNAGAMGARFNRPLVELAEEDWREMIDSHLLSSFLCIKHAAPIMIRLGWGRIINTSSIHGQVGGRATLGAYGAAKAAINSLTKTAARELGPHGITCNAVAPGFVQTEKLMSYMAEERLAALSEQVPVGRAAQPEEIAAAVVFLASNAASYVNGAVLDINGGRTEYL